MNITGSRELKEDDSLESTIYIGGLHQKVTIEMLYELFVTFGVIKHIDLPLDHKTQQQQINRQSEEFQQKLENPAEQQKHRGFAFIEYEEAEDSLSAIDNLDEGEFQGKIIRVKKARPIKQKQSRPVWHNEAWQIENAERVQQQLQEKHQQIQEAMGKA